MKSSHRSLRTSRVFSKVLFAFSLELVFATIDEVEVDLIVGDSV